MRWFVPAMGAALRGYRRGDFFADLGDCYEHGTGVAKDLNKTVELYQKTAGPRDSPNEIARIASNV